MATSQIHSDASIDADYFDTRRLHVKCLHNAIIIPGGKNGGGIVHNGHYLSEAMVHRGWHSNESLRIPCDVSMRHEAVVFLGEFYSCWGHCLTDGLKFAWALLPDELNNWKTENVKFVYVTNEPGERLYENFIRLWELIGIKREQLIRIETPVCFDRVYFPEESYYLDIDRGVRFYTTEYQKTIDYIRGQVVPNLLPPTHDVYFTRLSWKTAKHDFGERQLESAINNATQCECISPEMLSVEDLIRTIAECRLLIVTEGSIAHNAVFLQNGAKLIVLTKADYENGYQPPINQMRELKSVKIKAHYSKFLMFPEHPWFGPFFLCITPELGKHLGIRPNFPKIEFAKYCLHSWKFVIRYYRSRITFILKDFLHRFTSD